MYEQDYVKRIIKTIAEGLVSVFKGKNIIENSINEVNGNVLIKDDQLLEIMIKKYINEGEINKAEDILFESIETNKSPRNLEVALAFYEEINKWDEDKLSRCNFSREEIVNGLNEIKYLYNKENLK